MGLAHTDNITVNTQSSIRIEAAGKTLYFDPIEIRQATADADVIFITHDHYDHFSPEVIGRLMHGQTVLVVPERLVESGVKALGDRTRVRAVRPGERYEIEGIQVETVAAYNKTKPFHPKRNGWCGYVIEADGVRYYVAGDTDMQNENRKVKCDVALVPVGGTYTMDSTEAAMLVNEIKPQIAIPVHYGSIVGEPGDGAAFREHVDPTIEVVFKLDFAND